MIRHAYSVLLAVAMGLSIGAMAMAAEESKRAMTVDDLLAVERVADPQISPDGRWVVYGLTKTNPPVNSTSSTLWLAATDGSSRRQLTQTDKKDRQPRFSPDGRSVLFESNRGGNNQLWIISLEGGEAQPLTRLASEAQTGIWSPDGKHVAFVSAVWPEFSSLPFAEADAAHRKRVEEQEKNPVKARVYTRLFYRHWDSLVEGKRQHLFLVSVDGSSAAGEPKNLTPGDRDAYPTSTTFSVGDDFCFTPDGKAILFTAPATENEAWNTNHDIWRVSIEGGAPENLTADNPAADGYPHFSPDGRWLAYRAQSRAGFEADRWQLMLRPAAGGATRSLTASLDRSVDQFVWSHDSQAIWFLAEEAGNVRLFRIDIASGKIDRAYEPGGLASLSLARDGRMALVRSSFGSPPRVVVLSAQGKPERGDGTVADHNRERLAGLELPRPESIDIPVAGATMQMWLLKPPGFDAARHWPLIYLVHGGPQGAWHDAWSYRWNPQVWAAQGYVVAMPNPRGSTGFGQKFVDEISGDWGGKCFDDLMAGVAWIEQQPYIDTARMAAAGASFGGYMMNWFEGRTEKFKTLVCHCGVYNFDSMYASTEELWFDEWEHGGPPWGNRESYERYSPHRLAKDFKTPMLIIHNDLDYRVPVSEGHQLFTTLQRLGVPSRMVNFPDEGHWVLKPGNSRLWHEEIFRWLNQYAPPGAR